MSKEIPEVPTENRMRKEILGLVWLALGIFLLVCLLSYSSDDPSFNNNLNPDRINNLVGVFGAHLADLLYQAFGLTALLWPLGCLHLAWRWLKFSEVHFRATRLVAFLLLQITLGGLLALRFSEVPLFGSRINEAGGAIGRVLVQLLSRYLNLSGAAIILIVFFLVALILSTRFSLVLFIDGILQRFGRRLELRREARLARADLRRKTEKTFEIKSPTIIPPEPKKLIEKKAKGNKKKTRSTDEENQVAFAFLEPSGTYHMPAASLLEHDGGDAKPIDRDSLTMAARMLEKKLLDFGVEGDVVEVKPGPVVTMYEFAPAPGVKVNKIANLQDDLAMALQAVSIRIVAPIPGRGVVGIEIPNKDRETVYLKEIIESEAFQRNGGKLPMALGKDIFGQVVVSDLAKMPHLLVAGSTGSGKSVSVNTMILSLLYRATPDDVRLIMIDPKMLELSIYEGIPHLLLPVVTNPKKASLALAWAVREMERRYRLMADKGVRNIDGYNRKTGQGSQGASGPAARTGADRGFSRRGTCSAGRGKRTRAGTGARPSALYRCDCRRTCRPDDGGPAAKSKNPSPVWRRWPRGCGDPPEFWPPSAPASDVITGFDQSQFPRPGSRSRSFPGPTPGTVLDSMGAETLLGMGDMLFPAPGGSATCSGVHGRVRLRTGSPAGGRFSLQAGPARLRQVDPSGTADGRRGTTQKRKNTDERWGRSPQNRVGYPAGIDFHAPAPLARRLQPRCPDDRNGWNRKGIVGPLGRQRKNPAKSLSVKSNEPLIKPLILSKKLRFFKLLHLSRRHYFYCIGGQTYYTLPPLDVIL